MTKENCVDCVKTFERNKKLLNDPDSVINSCHSCFEKKYFGLFKEEKVSDAKKFAYFMILYFPFPFFIGLKYGITVQCIMLIWGFFVLEIFNIVRWLAKRF